MHRLVAVFEQKDFRVLRQANRCGGARCRLLLQAHIVSMRVKEGRWAATVRSWPWLYRHRSFLLTAYRQAWRGRALTYAESTLQMIVDIICKSVNISRMFVHLRSVP